MCIYTKVQMFIELQFSNGIFQTFIDPLCAELAQWQETETGQSCLVWWPPSYFPPPRGCWSVLHASLRHLLTPDCSLSFFCQTDRRFSKCWSWHILTVLVGLCPLTIPLLRDTLHIRLEVRWHETQAGTCCPAGLVGNFKRETSWKLL